MDLQEINELDLEDIGNWPMPAKIAINVIISVLVVILFYFLFVSDSLDELAALEKKEASIKVQFESKAALAGNLESYTSQMSEMTSLFDNMLKQLPSKSETAGLLDDLSYIGQHNGLQLRKLRWLSEVARDFSYEVPVSLEMIGTFHQLGKFTGDIADLPRIVTLEDFTITKLKGELLKVNMIARTYRYKGEK